MTDTTILVSSMSGNRDRCKEAIESLDLKTFYERHPPRWEAFSLDELRVLAMALHDSGSTHSDHSWYLRCSALHTQIVKYLEMKRHPEQLEADSKGMTK